MEKAFKIFKKADAVLIALFLVSAIALIFIFSITAGTAGYARVSVDGEVSFFNLAHYDGQELVFTSERGTNTVLIENNTARIVCADCPDHLCVRRGAISSTWHSLTCLPNHLAVTLIVDDPIDDGLPRIDVISH